MERADATTYGLAAVGAAVGFARYYIRPELTARRTWGLIGAVVLAHEVVCEDGQLLSEGADRLLDRHPVWPRVAGALVAGHVLNAIPDFRFWRRWLIRLALLALPSVVAGGLGMP